MDNTLSKRKLLIHLDVLLQSFKYRARKTNNIFHNIQYEAIYDELKHLNDLVESGFFDSIPFED